MMRRSLLLMVVVPLLGCRTSSPTSAETVPVGALVKEYRESVSAARDKYDGKEISVRGFVPSAAVLPVEAADQGEVWLKAANDDSAKLACWFSRSQAAEFSKVKTGQQLTIRGVFTGEAGVELKFCRIVEME